MSNQMLACPQCHTSLRSNRPVPAQQMVRCLQCGNHFPAGTTQIVETNVQATTPTTPARPPLSPVVTLLGAAAVAGFFLLGGSILLALVFLRPHGVSKEDLARLEAERAAADARFEEMDAQLKAAQRKLDFADLMKKGGDAMAKKNYDDAVKAYDAAMKLFPEDADAQEALQDAKVARKFEGKDKADKDQRDAKYAKLMDQGKKAMADKEYADAARAFESAAQILPGDEAANKALNDARTSLAALQDGKAKSAEYQVRMDAGREAVKGQRYADAVREFLAALRATPGDDAANKGLQDAEKKLADIGDMTKRKAEFDKLVERARASYLQKRFDDAIDTIQTALKLMPGDVEGAGILAAARQARTDAKNQYTQLIDKAVASMRVGQYEQAKTMFTDASRLFPDDPGAKNGLRDAQKALDEQAAFVRAVDLGKAAFAAQNYNEALGYYNTALGLRPDDVDTLLLLRKVRKLTERDVGDAVEFDRQMAIGKAAFDRKAYIEAAAAFKKAVELSPANLLAIESLHGAKYAADMAAGRDATNAKRYRDAVKSYEAALREIPGDPTATTALANAQQLAKAMESTTKDGGIKPNPPKP